MRVRAFRRVNRTVEQVWEVLADHEGMSEWSPMVSVTLERMGDPPNSDPAPNGVGAVRVVRMLGLTIREQVMDLSPQRRLAYRAISGIPFRDYSGEVVLTPDGENTGITWVLSSSHRSPAIRLLLGCTARLYVGALRRAAERRFQPLTS